MAILLGRQLLAPASKQIDALNGTDGTSEDVLHQIKRHDRFFCETMELIPHQYYFPTDEEENWIKSAPKTAKKYHKNVMAMKALDASKKSHKRVKYNPNQQKTNEERQMEAAEEEKQAKEPLQQEAKEPEAPPLKMDKNPTTTSMDSLKERLAAKIHQMREQRKADEKGNKKRKTPEEAKKQDSSAKKRKTINGNNATPKNHPKQGAPNTQPNVTASSPTRDDASEPVSTTEVSTSGISYGSLLLDTSTGTNAHEKKTRNGQSIRNIKNLLKKAERNKQRLEELKQTEEGRAVAQAKGWQKAIKQAGGDVVMDDPKLLRNKLKKKEKKKAKSSKEWAKRIATKEQATKEKQRKKFDNAMGKKTTSATEDAPATKKSRNSGFSKGKPRAGFEGKKGETFLNANKKK